MDYFGFKQVVDFEHFLSSNDVENLPVYVFLTEFLFEVQMFDLERFSDYVLWLANDSHRSNVAIKIFLNVLEIFFLKFSFFNQS